MTPAIFGLSGPILTDDERAFFREADPAGYILFGRNVENRAQLRALTDDLRAIHGRERQLVSTDPEDGRVARMKPPEWEAFPPGEAFARLWQVAPASAIEAARANGGALGNEPMPVAALGRATLDGLARAGVTGCVKHMPGHGRASADSHKELPTVTASEAELETDIEPFRTLRDAPIGMTAHVRYTAWDAGYPGTLSPFVINEIIRKRIGFSGLLLTDDIDMEALDGTVPERSERAIAAGCDVVLNCWAKMDDMAGIAGRLPAMSEETAARIDRALATSGSSASDRAQLIATRDALL